MAPLAVQTPVIPGHEDLLPEDRLSARDVTTWRGDLIGYRSASGGDLMIFSCACGCGGHVGIPVKQYAPIGRARAAAHARHGRDGAAFGRGFYIAGHAPDGIAASKARSGPRVALKATA